MQDFHLLMDDLGKLLDIPLIPDKHNACVLNFNDELSVQFEPDAPGHYLLLAIDIGELAAGKFRENILASGLKYNNTPSHLGTFAYLARKNLLVFFRSFRMDQLRAHEIADLLPPLLGLAMKWKKTIAAGNVPVVDTTTKESKPSIFDLEK